LEEACVALMSFFQHSLLAVYLRKVMVYFGFDFYFFFLIRVFGAPTSGLYFKVLFLFQGLVWALLGCSVRSFICTTMLFSLVVVVSLCWKFINSANVVDELF
jgi:hypothetical protein